ncbi:MAG: hypothetical protein M3281_04005 [Chloroflexota bacterium]|nr:hypothetical protein [Chloroflexota bacterium]
MATVQRPSGAESKDGGGLPGELLHAGGGVLVVLVTTTPSVYQPRSRTRWG